MIVALDLETTWVDNKKDKIIELALIKFDENTFEIIETFSTLINPQISIPEIISNITNIFDEDVKNAPIFDENLTKKVSEFIWDLPILWHNINFDRDFLINYGVDLEKNIVLDTFSLSNIIFFYEKSLNLWSLCEEKWIILDNLHRAFWDVKATIKLFELIIKKFKKLSKEKKELLNFIFSKSDSKTFLYYKKLFWFEDKIINEEEFIKKILKIIWKYRQENVKTMTCACFDKKKSNHKDYYYSIKQIFSSLPNSEFRENQLKMANEIENTLFQDKKIVIEAPTWIWKTFAYLIPSINYALQKEEQVIISTNTKALQDQIFYKDLEFLKQNLWYDFSFSKLKWRKNYFSVSRYFYQILENNFLDIDKTIFFSKICLWLFDTEFWELDELNLYPKELFYAKNINAEHFLVLFESNDYRNYEHIFKARARAQTSNIVIINHSLLVQDSTSNQPIFWQIKNLVIDEAHNLEDATTDANIKQFSLQSLKDSVEKLQNTFKKQNFTIDNLDKKFENLFFMISLIFDLFLDYAIKQNTSWNEKFESLIEKDFFEKNKDIKNLSNNIEIQIIDILNYLQTTPDKIYNSIKTEISNLEEILNIIKICLDENSSKEFISMFSYDKFGNNILYYTVLNPWNFLQKVLWDKIDSIVLTSATMKINDTFDYIKNTLALDDFDFISLESDFDYSRQAFLFIPNDLGSIKYQNSRIQEFILKFLTIVWWKTLVLLTSFNAIKELFLILNIPLKKNWISVLAQWVVGSKHKIANYFKKYSKNSVILWTDSFWEWVDLPGDDLKYLIIHKFPFLVPTDPIFKARWKLYSDQFRDYSIPKAIIKTRQGFWRLIRTKKDTWIVILLDDRYHSTDWWIAMRSSFPHNINIKIWDSNNFLELIKTKF